jgi:hypothetical protein
MPARLRRSYGTGSLHFITFSCYQRRPLLGAPQCRDLFLRILEETRIRYGIVVVGYVIMPEHVHLLLSQLTVFVGATNSARFEARIVSWPYLSPQMILKTCLRLFYWGAISRRSGTVSVFLSPGINCSIWTGLEARYPSART